MGKILELTADGRRRTQTFSSADLAEENRLALRAGEMIRTRRSAREGTIGFSSRSDCTILGTLGILGTRFTKSACVCGKKNW